MNRQQLEQKQNKGMRWNTILSVVIFLVQFVSLYFLNQWLLPSDFGQSAWALGVITMGLVLSNFSFTEVLIRQLEVKRQELSSVFILSLVVNTTLFLLFYFVIANLPLHAAQFAKPYTKAFSFTFLTNSLLIIPYVKLARDLEFTRISFIRLITKLLSIVLALLFGYYHSVFWSLFFLYQGGQILYSLAIAISTPWQLGLTWDFSFIRRELLTALSFLSHKILNAVGANLDVLLIGQKYGDIQVAQYHKSYGYKALPKQFVAQPIAQVTFPLFSKLQHSKARLSEAFLNAQNLTAFLLLPLLFLFIALAKPFTYIYFSAGQTTWDVDLIYKLLMAFGVAGLFAVFDPNYYSLFSVMSDKKQINRLIFSQRLLLILMIIVLYQFGLLPLAIGNAVIEGLILFMNAYVAKQYISKRTIQFALPTFFKTLAIALFSGLASRIMYNTLSTPQHSIALFLGCCVFAGMIYILLSFWLNKKAFNLFTNLLFGR